MASIQLDQFLQQSVCIQRSPCCGKDREKGLDEEESEKCGVEKQIDERFTHFQMTTFFPITSCSRTSWSIPRLSLEKAVSLEEVLTSHSEVHVVSLNDGDTKYKASRSKLYKRYENMNLTLCRSGLTPIPHRGVL